MNINLYNYFQNIKNIKINLLYIKLIHIVRIHFIHFTQLLGVMTDLILSFLYNSSNFDGNLLLENVKTIKGISVIDIKSYNMRYVCSNKGIFFVHYKGKSKEYEASFDNLDTLKKMLDVLNIV